MKNVHEGVYFNVSLVFKVMQGIVLVALFGCFDFQFFFEGRGNWDVLRTV